MKKAFIKRMSAALCALALLIGTSLMAAAPSHAETKTYSAENARYGCVRLYAEWIRGGFDSGNAGLSAGFFVGKQGEPVEYIVTSWYSVMRYVDESGREAELPDFVWVLFDTDATKDVLKAVPVFYVPEIDLAVLRLQEPTALRAAMPLMSRDYVSSDEAYVVGFPTSDVTNISYVRSGIEDMSVTKVTLGDRETFANNAEYYRMSPAAVNPYRNGGPLVTKDGCIIGLNTMGSDGKQTDCSLAIDYVMQILEQNNIGFTFAEPDMPDSAGSTGGATQPEEPSAPATAGNSFDEAFGGGAFIGIAIGAVVLVGGLILRGAIKKKTREKEPPTGGRVGPASKYTDGGKPADMSVKPSFSAAPPAPPTYTPPASAKETPAPARETPAPASRGLRSSSSFGTPKTGAPTPGASGPKPPEDNPYFKKNSGF